MLKPPVGYRLLNLGEVIRPLDLFNCNQEGKWVSYESFYQNRSSVVIEPMHYEFCRPIEISPMGNIIVDRSL